MQSSLQIYAVNIVYVIAYVIVRAEYYFEMSAENNIF